LGDVLKGGDREGLGEGRTASIGIKEEGTLQNEGGGGLSSVSIGWELHSLSNRQNEIREGGYLDQ